MRFEEAYEGWMSRHLTQEEAAILLGVCDRTFRRYIGRYDAKGRQIQDESDLPCSVRREQSAPRMTFRATPFKASLAAM